MNNFQSKFTFKDTSIKNKNITALLSVFLHGTL